MTTALLLLRPSLVRANRFYGFNQFNLEQNGPFRNKATKLILELLFRTDWGIVEISEQKAKAKDEGGSMEADSKVPTTVEKLAYLVSSHFSLSIKHSAHTFF